MEGRASQTSFLPNSIFQKGVRDFQRTRRVTICLDMPRTVLVSASCPDITFALFPTPRSVLACLDGKVSVTLLPARCSGNPKISIQICHFTEDKNALRRSEARHHGPESLSEWPGTETWGSSLLAVFFLEICVSFLWRWAPQRRCVLRFSFPLLFTVPSLPPLLLSKSSCSLAPPVSWSGATYAQPRVCAAVG